MHGYSFSVMAVATFKNGQNKEDIIEDLRRGAVKLSKNPPYKDTIAVPSVGYAVIRIVAKNPGKE
jgi:hypothetical protein